MCMYQPFLCLEKCDPRRSGGCEVAAAARLFFPGSTIPPQLIVAHLRLAPCDAGREQPSDRQHFDLVDALGLRDRHGIRDHQAL